MNDTETCISFGYSVFVNGRDRSTILEDMQARIDRENIDLERTDAIKVRATLPRLSIVAEYSRQCVRSPRTEPASWLLERVKKRLYVLGRQINGPTRMNAEHEHARSQM